MGQEACYLKVLLDSRAAADLADRINIATQSLSKQIFTDAIAYPIINEIITAEQALVKAENLLLDAAGYKGPRP